MREIKTSIFNNGILKFILHYQYQTQSEIILYSEDTSNLIIDSTLTNNDKIYLAKLEINDICNRIFLNTLPVTTTQRIYVSQEIGTGPDICYVLFDFGIIDNIYESHVFSFRWNNNLIEYTFIDVLDFICNNIELEFIPTIDINDPNYIPNAINYYNLTLNTLTYFQAFSNLTINNLDFN